MSFELLLGCIDQVLNFTDDLREFFSDVIQEKLAQEVLERLNANSVFGDSAQMRALKELALVDIALLESHAVLNFLRRPILHNKPSMIESFDRVLSNRKNLQMSATPYPLGN
jgi:hypothetical protein